MKLENVKLIIFDLDGTLADTIPGIRNAVNCVRAEYGLAPLTSEQTAKGLNHGIGNLMDVTVATDLGDRTPETREKLIASYLVHLENTFEDEVVPYPNLPEALAELKARGYRLAVLSNKPDRFVKPQIRSLYGDTLFSAARGIVDINFRKPNPELTLSVIHEVDETLRPDECVMIGDSDVDIDTAKNAGMRSVAVSWGYRDKELLRAKSPDVIVDTAAELLALF